MVTISDRKLQHTTNYIKLIFEPLKKLLDTRNKLRDLLTKADRSEDLEALLERVLQDTEQLKTLSKELGVEKQGA